jgi:hypothetical protein
MMHIVHIIDSLARGGAETLLVGIVNGLPNQQHTIILLYGDNDFKKEIKNAHVISLPAFMAVAPGHPSFKKTTGEIKARCHPQPSVLE